MAEENKYSEMTSVASKVITIPEDFMGLVHLCTSYVVNRGCTGEEEHAIDKILQRYPQLKGYNPREFATCLVSDIFSKRERN